MYQDDHEKAFERLEKKKCDIIRIHPTEKSLDILKTMFDQSIITEGQLAIDRVKTCGNLENYFLQAFSERIFNEFTTEALWELWIDFRAKYVKQKVYFRTWMDSFLKFNYTVLRDILQAHNFSSYVKEEYGKFFDCVLILGLVPYKIQRSSSSTKSDPKFKNVTGLVSKETFKVFSLLEKEVADIKSSGVEVLSLDKVVIVYDKHMDTFICEPLLPHSDEEYFVLPVSPPTYYFGSFQFNSIAVRLTQQMKEAALLVAAYRKASLYLAIPYRAILTNNNDDMKKTDKNLPQSLKQALDSMPNSDLISRYLGKKDSKTPAGVDYESVSILPGMPSIIQKTRQQFSQQYINNYQSSDTTSQPLVEQLSKLILEISKKNEEQKKYIGHLLKDNAKKDYHQQEKEEVDLLNIDGHAKFFEPPFIDSYKIFAASTTPKLPELEPVLKNLSDNWLTALRDCFGFKPEYNAVNHKIDECPSFTTEGKLYKPFLDLLNCPQNWSFASNQPMSLENPYLLYTTVFKNSFVGHILVNYGIQDDLSHDNAGNHSKSDLGKQQ